MWAVRDSNSPCLPTIDLQSIPMPSPVTSPTIKIIVKSRDKGNKIPQIPLSEKRVENNGFEPLTPCLQSRCSSQLS